MPYFSFPLKLILHEEKFYKHWEMLSCSFDIFFQVLTDNCAQHYFFGDFLCVREGLLFDTGQATRNFSSFFVIVCCQCLCCTRVSVHRWMRSMWHLLRHIYFVRTTFRNNLLLFNFPFLLFNTLISWKPTMHRV